MVTCISQREVEVRWVGKYGNRSFEAISREEGQGNDGAQTYEKIRKSGKIREKQQDRLADFEKPGGAAESVSKLFV